MAILTPGVGDRHLLSTAGNFSRNAVLSNTLMSWVNVPSWTSPAVVSLVGVYTGITTSVTAIQIGSRGGVLSVWTWGGGVLINTLVAPPINEWIHVAYSYDGTLHRLYLNGILTRTITNGTGGFASQVPGILNTVFINGFPGGAALESATFEIDDVAFFERQLSDDEILTTFTSAGGRDGIVFGELTSYYLDEGPINTPVITAIDITGRGNNLTVAGTATTNFLYSPSFISGDLRKPL